MSKIFYIMGKSSSGKDTIYKKIREKLPQLKRITPYTTRPIREGETDGVEYFFVDEERLNELKEKYVLIIQSVEYGHILQQMTGRLISRSMIIL